MARFVFHLGWIVAVISWIASAWFIFGPLNAPDPSAGMLAGYRGIVAFFVGVGSFCIGMVVVIIFGKRR